MQSDLDIRSRIDRIDAALSTVVEPDLAKFPPRIQKDGKATILWQDFSGTQTPAELINAAMLPIAIVGHVDDHLKVWAGRDRERARLVLGRLRGCKAFAVVKDLANRDKHPAEPHRGGYSGLSPSVANVRRVMRITTGNASESGAAVVLTPTGPVVSATGSGAVNAIITGDVLDHSGKRIGDLHDILCEAVDETWKLLEELGFRP